jgi:ELWxxDGT repeat protein
MRLRNTLSVVLVALVALVVVVVVTGLTAQRDGLRLDANPGDANVCGTLFFVANDGAHADELWKSDGTRAGTVLVKDINPIGRSSPRELTDVGGTLFLVANDGVHGLELWKSDGTRAGTVLVKDIHPIKRSST